MRSTIQSLRESSLPKESWKVVPKEADRVAEKCVAIKTIVGSEDIQVELQGDAIVCKVVLVTGPGACCEWKALCDCSKTSSSVAMRKSLAPGEPPSLSLLNRLAEVPVYSAA